jgi:hypothetical protein
MRPASIVNFERVVLLSVLLTLVSLAMNWDAVMAAFAPYRVGATFILVAHAVLIGLFLLILWLVSRRGSPVAKWIYVLIVVLSLLVNLTAYPSLLASGQASPIIMTVAQDVLIVLSLWFLFRPESAPWFRRDGADSSPAEPA